MSLLNMRPQRRFHDGQTITAGQSEEEMEANDLLLERPIPIGPSEGVFRFLDLPAELRLRVYELYFEGNEGREIWLFRVRPHAPEDAITAVSRGVREESLPLYVRACHAFWATSTFMMFTCEHVNDPEWRSFVLSQCQSIPGLGIRKLRYVIGQLEENGGPGTINVEVSASDGLAHQAPQWRMWYGGKPASDETAELTQEARESGNHLQYASYSTSPGGLNVAACTATFFEWQEQDPRFQNLVHWLWTG
ncbi:hypothetical protein LTR27_006657 [Elasticomyces elasticus]|nr:hypothetical protein LTR27_006657 [Elasticomyces elasticus]